MAAYMRAHRAHYLFLNPAFNPSHCTQSSHLKRPASVPPNLYSANRRLQPLLSPSFISPTLSLPNIHSPTPDNILHHQSIAPLAYRRLNNPHLHQPTS
jgi:hypothetical protein